MLVGAELFIHQLRGFRMLWLNGRFGSGKTCLSVAVAHDLARRGLIKRVVSNIPINGAEVPPPMPLRDAVIILDEANIFLDKWSAAKEYVTFLRKKNLYLIMPTIFPPARNLRMFRVQRTVNLSVMGLPVWHYRWTLKQDNVAESGTFNLWHPSDYFGVYDTTAAPIDDGGIGDVLKKTFNLDKLEKRVDGYEKQYSEAGAFESAIEQLPDLWDQ